MTRVLVVGGGGREHAIAEAVVRSGGEVVSTLKNRNPGILRISRSYALLSERDAPAIARKAVEWGVDVAVLGMDASIEAGVADALRKEGIAVASPTREAGKVEWNKGYLRELLDRYSLPGRIRYRLFTSSEEIPSFIREVGEVAVKPLGLTGGKGVKVMGDHLSGPNEAVEYAGEVLRKEGAVLLEEKIKGEEFSLQAFTDGRTVVPLPAVQDHKRAWEFDRGPNTGGMGSYSDRGGLLPFLSPQDYEEASSIVRKVVEALHREGNPFVGTIYGQFMATATGVRLIEVNSRFGDPEAINVLELLESSFVDVLEGMAHGHLSRVHVRFRDEATVCTYVVPEGYGVNPASGERIEVDENLIRQSGSRLYYAAVEETPEGLWTTTSRSLALVACAPTIEEAHRKVEEGLKGVRGRRLYVRHDVGSKELISRRVEHLQRLRSSGEPSSPPSPGGPPQAP